MATHHATTSNREERNGALLIQNADKFDQIYIDQTTGYGVLLLDMFLKDNIFNMIILNLIIPRKKN